MDVDLLVRSGADRDVETDIPWPHHGDSVGQLGMRLHTDAACSVPIEDIRVVAADGIVGPDIDVVRMRDAYGVEQVPENDVFAGGRVMGLSPGLDGAFDVSHHAPHVDWLRHFGLRADRRRRSASTR